VDGPPNGLPETPPEIQAMAAKVASDATSVADWLRLFLTPPEPPPRPKDAFAHPKDAADNTFTGAFWALKDLGIPQPLAYLFAAAAAAVVMLGGELGMVLFWLIKNVGATLTIDVLELIDDVRKDLNPTMVALSTAVLNELLGTDYKVDPGAAPGSGEDPILNAEAVGGLLHDRLLEEFQGDGDVTPESGRTAARRMSGFLINFGVATAFTSILGETLSFGKFEQFRELGVEVARNLGLGRLNRQAMKPLVDVMIAQPYKWWFHQMFHPTQFTIGQVINPFSQSLMPVEDIFRAGDLDGFSHDKIEKLIQLHQKRLTPEDVELLARWKAWDPVNARDYIENLGYPADLADTVTQMYQFKRYDARINKLIDAAESAVLDGHITLDEFSSFLDTMPFNANEAALIVTTVQYKLKAPRKALTFAQLTKAFEDGMIDDTELRDRLTAQGYSAEDVDILEVQVLLAFAKLTDAANKKAAAAAKKAAKNSGVPTPPPAPAP